MKIATPTFTKKQWIIGVILFIVVNLILRLLFINRNDVAMDEPFSIWWAQHDLSSLFNMLKTENNPPLHFIILHYWIKLFGINTLSVRLPSVIFSSMAAGILFYTGAKFLSQRAAILATSVFTISTMQIYFSHEARVYPLFVLLSIWNIYLLLSITGSPEKKITFVWLLLNNILLVYSHYFGWIPVLVQLFILVAFPWRKYFWKSVLLSFALLIIAYIPNIIIAYNRFIVSSGGTWVRPPQWSELYGNINRFLNSRWVTLAFIAVGGIGLLIIIINKKYREFIVNLRNHKAWIIVLLFFLIPWIGMFAISFFIPIFLDRYLLFTSPALYLVLTGFFELLPLKKILATTLAIVPLLVMCLFFDPAPSNNRNIKDVVEKIKSLRQTKDAVIISPDYSSLEFCYHYNNIAFADYSHTKELLLNDHIYAVNSLQMVPSDVLDHCDKIIYLDCESSFAFGADIVGNELKSNYSTKSTIHIPGIYNITQFTKVNSPTKFSLPSNVN